MAELLGALGWRTSLRDRARLIALAATSTTAILIAGLVLAVVVPIVLVQAAIWAAWLVWLGMVFPRNSRRDLAAPCELPYKRAFMREILLGISVAFSQFLRPVVAGLVLDGGSLAPDDALAIGVALLLGGGTAIAIGVSALGVARTLFVHEYVPGQRYVVRSGIYRYVRHPLFLGGALVSLGLAICSGNQTAVELGLVSACVLPVYIRLEDRRCCAVLGREYVDYSIAVGSLVPRRRSAIRPVAHLHQAAGRIEPMAGRAAVTRR
ncbi:MAG: methanethiol S-methyltransferase [Solirubrobacterales bacterium]|jgi:protein-S-isoprenylcysteine O-methyltransferase Ste14|nr:methanethiol S-methyltransferase [Solirubrobacterales bacterium]